MKYFLDTEFIEGTQKTFFGQTKPTIDLISIGVVNEYGDEYYAISKDFNLKEAWNRFDLKPDIDNGGMKKVYWIRENVLRPIWEELSFWDEGLFSKNGTYFFGRTKGVEVKGGFTHNNLKTLIAKYGKTNKQIAKEIEDFIRGCEFPSAQTSTQKAFSRLGKINPEFYAYYCSYDWVAFCWIFGKMIDLPKGFPMYCNDLKQTFDEKQYYWAKLEDGFRLKYAMENNLYSSEIDLKNLSNYPKQTNEHNALADAKWNFELYKFLQSIKLE